MNTLRFSVIIPTYGRSRVFDAIRSVLDQQPPRTDIEVIVVDDAGEPRAVVPEGVRLIRREINGGSGAARNTGIGAARGSWVVFLDDDDRLLPGWLSAIDEAIRAHPEWSIVTAEAEYVLEGTRLGRRVVRRALPEADQFAELLREPYLTVICAVERGVLERSGGFDQTLTRYEDFELWARLLHAGAEAGLVSEVLAHVEAGAGKSGDRVTSLRQRAVVLEQMLGWDLTERERQAGVEHLERTHDELLLEPGRQAVMQGLPARRDLWRAVRGMSGHKRRARALAAWVSPGLARRVMLDSGHPWSRSATPSNF